jgi:hypothetical protein
VNGLFRGKLNEKSCYLSILHFQVGCVQRRAQALCILPLRQNVVRTFAGFRANDNEITAETLNLESILHDVLPGRCVAALTSTIRLRTG